MVIKIKAFIFDMDGTIIDNMRFHIQAWQEFLSNLGVELTQKEIQDKNMGTIEEVMRRFCGEDLSNDEVVELGNQKELIYRNLYRPHLKPISGLNDFLNQAQQLNILMAIATSAGKPNIDFTLDGLEIRSYFAATVGGDDVEQGKPHPETFLTAARKLDVSPEECLIFEDSLSGIEAAQNTRMKAIAIATTLPTQVFEKKSVVQQVIQDYRSLNLEYLLEI